MTKAIELLERFGQDAGLRAQILDEVQNALSRSDISPELAAALTSGNQSALDTLLGARTNVACMVFPAKDDEDEEEKPDDDKDAPDENPEKSLLSPRRVAVGY
jgi:hypothetical protein